MTKYQVGYRFTIQGGLAGAVFEIVAAANVRNGTQEYLVCNTRTCNRCYMSEDKINTGTPVK